jgi:hypothetical protein
LLDTVNTTQPTVIERKGEIPTNINISNPNTTTNNLNHSHTTATTTTINQNNGAPNTGKYI